MTGSYPLDSIWHLRKARDNPIEFLERLAAEGDVVPFTIAGRSACLLNHPDHVERVLVSSPAAFRKPPAMTRSKSLLGRGLLTADGLHHERRRRIAQPAFTPRRLEGYASTITSEALRAAGAWRDGSTVDLAASMHGLTMAIIGRLLFGADLSPYAAEVGRAMAEAAASLDPLLSLLAPERRLAPASRYLRTLVDRLIDEHSPSQEEPDILAVLRRAEGSAAGPAGDELRDDVATIFVAGHDTVANALVWTWHLLAGAPEVEDRLGRELQTELADGAPRFEDIERLPYTRAVFLEALRLYPPAWVLTRQALADHPLAGLTITAGTIVVVSQFLLHRDARFHPDPLEFRPSRWLGGSQPAQPRLAYFPFGAGPRACIGQGLAMIEGPLVLATLAARWRCRPLGPIDADARATLRPRGPVAARVERRSAQGAA